MPPKRHTVHIHSRSLTIVPRSPKFGPANYIKPTRTACSKQKKKKNRKSLPSFLEPKMTAPTVPDLTKYKALSFDCYGTLIDWENGLSRDLSPILSQLPPTHPWNLKPLTAVEHFNAHSEHLWATKPTQLYQDNLSESFSLLAKEAGVSLPPPGTEVEAEAENISNGPARWPAFEDTIPALLKLQQQLGLKLIILSNVSNSLIQATIRDNLSPIKFDAVYTAENIGSYKPSLNNFHFLFRKAKEEMGIDWTKGELLHVARSLTADHVPCAELGLDSVWITRGGDTPETYGTGGNLEELREQEKVRFLCKFDTLGEFADEVGRQVGEPDREGKGNEYKQSKGGEEASKGRGKGEWARHMLSR